MKYEITKESKKIKGTKVYRIKRLHDGLIGGFVEHGDNLSQHGDCFIYDDAVVMDDGAVYGDATVMDNALVAECGSVHDDAGVVDYAQILGDACVMGQSCVTGRCVVSGYCTLIGSTHLRYGHHKISPIQVEMEPFYVNEDGRNLIRIGCDWHTADYWRKHANELARLHRLNKKVYLALVEAICLKRNS